MGNLEMKNLETQAGISVGRLIRRIQEMYERISDTEATLGEINSSVKENVHSKNLLSEKYEEKPGLFEKSRYKTIGNKNSDIKILGKGNKTQTQKYFQQLNRINIPYLAIWDTSQGIGNILNTK